MPLTFDLDSVAGIAIGTGEGVLSLEEIELAVTTLWRQIPGPRFIILWDLLEAQAPLSTNEVRELAQFIASNGPTGEIRTAFAVAGDLEFGLIRMFAVFRESEGAQIFVSRDREAAIEWLRQGKPSE